MTDTTPDEGLPSTLPSVDDARPIEEGGSAARSGFSYQDEIAIGFLIEMLEDPFLLKVHCETHDDILLVRTIDGAGIRVAEFVQVKASEKDKLWSISDLCVRKNAKAGTSIFEISLARDKHSEESRFRIVTLRPVDGELKMLTFQFGTPGREIDGRKCKTLLTQLDKRCPNFKSQKGNGSEYWIKNCVWDERHSPGGSKNHALSCLRPACH